MKYLKNQNSYILLFIVFFFFSCNQLQKKEESKKQVTKSEIRKTDAGYRIFVDGKDSFVEGIGIYGGSIGEVAKHGPNFIRTWNTENGKEVLDTAHELGLKVMLGIWIVSERHGFDYYDTTAVKKQFEKVRKLVIKYKDHPALAIWGIGNELNLKSTTPKVWEAVNDISSMIHELDPQHLTTTSLAGFDKNVVDLVQNYAPDLDFLSTQLYEQMDELSEVINSSGYEGGLLITEWGPTGYWEADTTQWGAPIESNSSEKADLYMKRYNESILSQSDQVMGSFVFFWGQKQERTPTWFGMLMPNGNETETVDVMHYNWNKGKWPENRSPRLHDFKIGEKRAKDNIKLKAGNSYSAEVMVTDPENDTLTFRWEIMKESTSIKIGGDSEYIPESFSDLFVENSFDKTMFRAPKMPGAYRLFVYIEDGNNHTAHANIPFLVE